MRRYQLDRALHDDAPIVDQGVQAATIQQGGDGLSGLGDRLLVRDVQDERGELVESDGQLIEGRGGAYGRDHMPASDGQ